MASPFQQMQRQAMEGLYGMGLTGEMDISEIRRRQQQMQQFSSQAQGIFGRSAFQPQTETSTFGGSSFGGGNVNMPFSSTMMGGGEDRYRQLLTSAGVSPSSAGLGQPSYSSTSNWSSMGAAPRFPYGGMSRY
jgi:hypothetical protein